MATIDLGKISFVNKGTWSSSTAYTERDVVQYTDNGILSSYVAVANSTNQVPSTSGTVNSSNWNFLAKGGASGDSFGLSNNQIPLKDNSGNLGGLSIGTAGQVLKVNSNANGYEFGAAGGSSDIVEIGSAIVSGQSSGSVTDINIQPTYDSSLYYMYKVVGWIDTHSADALRCRLLDTSGNPVTTSSYKFIKHWAKQTTVSGGGSVGGQKQGNGGGDNKWDLSVFAPTFFQGYALSNFVYYHTPQGWGSGWSNNGYKSMWGWHTVQGSGNDMPTPQAFNGRFDGSAAQHNGLRFSFLYAGSVKDAVIKYYGFKK